MNGHKVVSITAIQKNHLYPHIRSPRPTPAGDGRVAVVWTNHIVFFDYLVVILGLFFNVLGLLMFLVFLIVGRLKYGFPPCLGSRALSRREECWKFCTRG
jgi:hypothetical protein